MEDKVVSCLIFAVLEERLLIRLRIYYPGLKLVLTLFVSFKGMFIKIAQAYK